MGQSPIKASALRSRRGPYGSLPPSLPSPAFPCRAGLALAASAACGFALSRCCVVQGKRVVLALVGPERLFREDQAVIPSKPTRANASLRREARVSRPSAAAFRGRSGRAAAARPLDLTKQH